MTFFVLLPVRVSGNEIHVSRIVPMVSVMHWLSLMKGDLPDQRVLRSTSNWRIILYAIRKTGH